MSPEEAKLLQHAGQLFLMDIGIVVTQSILYGLYLSIFAFGIRALLKRSSWTRYTWTLLGFLSILFFFLTVNLAAFVAITIGLIRGALINNPDHSLTERFQLANDSVKGLHTIVIWLGGGSGGAFLFVFADSVVVWRACVLWPGNKIAKALPLALLFLSFVSAVVGAALEYISSLESRVVLTSSPTGITEILSVSLSLGTNVVATMLIGYKAYYHRRTMKTAASVGMQSSRSGAVLSFLTESGAVFCVLQAIGLATNTADNTSFTVLDSIAAVWQEINLFAAAAYPVLILIIMDNHRSISDQTGGSVGDSDQGANAGSLGVGSHLSFAVRPPGLSSSSGGEIGTGSFHTDPTVSADQSNGFEYESVRMQDLEKGKVLNGVVPTGNRGARSA